MASGLIDNPQLMSQLAKNGSQFAKRNFTKEQYGGEYYRLLNELRNEDQTNFYCYNNLGELSLKQFSLISQLNCENNNTTLEKFPQ